MGSLINGNCHLWKGHLVEWGLWAQYFLDPHLLPAPLPHPELFSSCQKWEYCLKTALISHTSSGTESCLAQGYAPSLGPLWREQRSDPHSSWGPVWRAISVSEFPMRSAKTSIEIVLQPISGSPHPAPPPPPSPTSLPSPSFYRCYFKSTPK